MSFPEDLEENAHTSTTTCPGPSTSVLHDVLPPSYIAESGGSGTLPRHPGAIATKRGGLPPHTTAEGIMGAHTVNPFKALVHPIAGNPFTTQDECVRQSLSRPPAPGPSYASFEPMFLLAEGKNLNKGFPRTPPPSDSHPHPFASHDVNELDWVGFLTEAKAAGSLTEKDIKHSKIPIVNLVPFVNRASAHGVQQFMKSHKEEAVMQVIQKWSHHFFEPRKMRVILMKGRNRVPAAKGRLSSLDPLPPQVYASIPDESDCRFRLLVVSV
ncbi:hypothetical protein NLJ89_g9800 [Agrocybe chaxingu]|uniref:Uncharacterized protein n=1 Tax=Agrocybe chaxingu TaxID=84603 RepID=A0A9W8JST6_9AGAR|nr:hypothetical protein NLJ89_g9800 [Agrocybe chaxingu]